MLAEARVAVVMGMHKEYGAACCLEHLALQRILSPSLHLLFLLRFVGISISSHHPTHQSAMLVTSALNSNMQ